MILSGTASFRVQRELPPRNETTKAKARLIQITLAWTSYRGYLAAPRSVWTAENKIDEAEEFRLSVTIQLFRDHEARYKGYAVSDC